MTAVTWLIWVEIILPRTPRVTIRLYPKSASGPAPASATQIRQELLDPFRSRRGEFDDFPEGWMDECERGRVERVAIERDRRACTRLSVHRVAHDRVAE